MARKHTGPENVIVNEGRTGRIIARRILRRVLGNPKKRKSDTEALALEMFSKGVNVGAEMMQSKIVNATANLSYEETNVPDPDITSAPMFAGVSDPPLVALVEDGSVSAGIDNIVGSHINNR